MKNKINKMITTIDRLDLIFGFLFSLIFLVGMDVYYEVSFNLFNPFLRLVLTLILFSAFGTMFSFMFCFFSSTISYLKIFFDKHKLPDKFFKDFWLAASVVVLFGIHLICYISYYPGVFSYDIPNSLYQISSNNFWNQQPILYTFFIKLILAIVKGDYTKMLVVYSIIQITSVIFICFFCLLYLQKRNVSNWLILFGYAYFLFVPILHVFAITTTKEIFFSCFFLLFSVSYIELGKRFCWKDFLIFVLSGFVSCLLRNNMIYAFLLFFFVRMFFERTKRILFGFTFIFVLFIAANCVFSLLGFAESPVHEMLCVPINQLSYVYVKENEFLSQGDKSKLLEFIPKADYYNPRFVDPVKDTFNDNLYYRSSSKFWDIYLSLLKRYPLDFVKSFLNINIPYWFVCADPMDSYSKRQYIETYVYRLESYPIAERENYLPAIGSFYESFANFECPVMRLFPFSLFYSLSFPFLELMFCLYAGIKQKNKLFCSVYLVGLFLLFTYLLGPVSNFRYVYTFYLCLPLYLGILFVENNTDLDK